MYLILACFKVHLSFCRETKPFRDLQDVNSVINDSSTFSQVFLIHLLGTAPEYIKSKLINVKLAPNHCIKTLLTGSHSKNYVC